MANTNLTIDQITNESLMVLENETVFSRNVDKQHDSTFAREGAKIGNTLRIRLPDQYTLRTGAALSVQDAVETSVTLTVDNQVGVDLNFTSEELTMDIDKFAERKLKPAIAEIANKIDLDGLDEYKNIAQQVGTPGTTPATALIILQAAQKLDESATPRDGNRCVNVDPAANASLIDSLKGVFNPNLGIASQYKSGLFGENVLGFKEISVDQNIARHTVGAHAGTPLTNGAVANGASSVVTDGWDNSVTGLLLQGDVFTIAGVYSVNPRSKQSTGNLKQFVVTADVNSGASTGPATISISPTIYDATTGKGLQNVSALPADGAAIVVTGSASTEYPINMVYHKTAITLATADLIMPGGVDMASRQVHNGISLRIVRAYDINNDKFPCRVDVLYGWKVQREELACRLIG